MASTDSQFIKLDFMPGIHRESTEYSEESKWYDSNRVRFREGKPENLRGYSKFGSFTLNGIPRHIMTWSDNNTRPYQAIGTNTNLYVVQNETIYDVSPIISVVSVSSNFQTFSGSSLVKVSINNHTLEVPDRILFEGVDTFANIDINGIRSVVSVSGTNHFYVVASTSADSNTSDQGTTGNIQYLFKVQQTDDIQGLGYGAGAYNAPRVSNTGWNAPSTQSAIIFLANQWSFDNWGEDLLAVSRGSKLFYMDTDASTTPTRTVIITASPSCNSFLVSPNAKHVVCYGSKEFANDGDPAAKINNMVVRWSSQANFNDWTPTAFNTAGEVELAEGSRIVGAIRSRNTINLWTDRAMYTQQYVGSPFIFRFTQVGSNCGLIGPHAAVDYDGASFWMSENNFFAYDGRVQTLPCPIRRKVFEDFNHTNQAKVYAGINSEFKEIIWLYPLANSPEPNAYVIYNVEERTWVYGKLFADGITTAFENKNVYSNTLITGRTSAAGDMYVWNNEPSNTYTGDGQSLVSYIQSAPFDLDEGKQMMFANKIIPDYTLGTGQAVNFSFKVRNYPNGTESEKGPYTINQNTNKVDVRMRGRQAAIRVSGTNSGQWRWGAVRLAVQPDGER